MDENMRVLMERLEELLRNVHQYVGARYVPNFIDDPWNDTTRYEALDVVDNGQGTSYIAKKSVPPGTPLSDRNYWFVYGSTSGAILNLQNQIDAINNNVIPPIQNAITDLQNNTLKTRKYALITDSYGAPQVPSETPFPEFFRRFMGLTDGVDFCTAYIGGAGFVANTVQFTEVVDRLHDYFMNGIDPDDITDFIICGGCNDSYITDHTQLTTAIYNTVQYVKTKFPNTKVYIAVTGGLGGLARKANMVNNVIPYYLNCAKYGAYPLPNVEYVMMNKSMFYESVDPTHPTEAGARNIAAALAAAMNKGYTYLDSVGMTFTPASGTLTIGGASTKVTNNVIDITISGLRLDFGSVQSISNEFVLGTFANEYIYGNNVDWLPCRVVCAGGTGDGRYDCQVVFNNGEFLIEFPESMTTQVITIPRMHGIITLTSC